jgi:hypothetical protein
MAGLMIELDDAGMVPMAWLRVQAYYEQQHEE